MQRNRVHREVVVQLVGLVQRDRERRGGRGGHDHRAGHEGGLTGPHPAVPACLRDSGGAEGAGGATGAGDATGDALRWPRRRPRMRMRMTRVREKG